MLYNGIKCKKGKSFLRKIIPHFYDNNFFPRIVVTNVRLIFFLENLQEKLFWMLGDK